MDYINVKRLEYPILRLIFSFSHSRSLEPPFPLSKKFEPQPSHWPVAMDLHPTPFPGKRRPAENLIANKEKDHPKPAASHTQSKTKRSFGRNLSGNMMVEKPSQKTLTAKPWKPSGISKNTQKAPKKVATALPCAGGAKSGSNKKAHHVTFVEMQPPAVAAVDESMEVSHDDLLVCTPVLSSDTFVQETRYQSAENCSKCRLDRLETSSHWISQVKLAETTGKHFVSAAFFRLALQCEAQPFVILQNELKHYRDRHGVVFMESLWDDLCRDYRLTGEQPDAKSSDVHSIDAVLVEQFDSKCTVKEEGDGNVESDMCTVYDIIDQPEDMLENFKAKNDEPEKIFLVEQSEDGMLQRSLSIDSPLKSCHCVESPSFNPVLGGGDRRSLKFVPKKSKFGDITSTDLATNSRTNKAVISSKQTGQAGAKNSGSQVACKKKDRDIIGSRDRLKVKSSAEKHYTSKHFDDNVNPVDDRDNVEGEDNEIFNND